MCGVGCAPLRDVWKSCVLHVAFPCHIWASYWGFAVVKSLWILKGFSVRTLNKEWAEIHHSGSGRTGIKTRGQATYRALWFTQLYRNNTGGVPMAMAYVELWLRMNEGMIAMRTGAAEGKGWVVFPVPACSRPVVLPLVFVPLPWVALNLVRFSACNFFSWVYNIYVLWHNAHDSISFLVLSKQY